MAVFPPRNPRPLLPCSQHTHISFLLGLPPLVIRGLRVSEMDTVLYPIHARVSERDTVLYPIHTRISREGHSPISYTHQLGSQERATVLYPIHTRVSEMDTVIYPIHTRVSEMDTVLYPIHTRVSREGHRPISYTHQGLRDGHRPISGADLGILREGGGGLGRNSSRGGLGSRSAGIFIY